MGFNLLSFSVVLIGKQETRRITTEAPEEQILQNRRPPREELHEQCIHDVAALCSHQEGGAQRGERQECSGEFISQK